jgi:hypothetical protein
MNAKTRKEIEQMREKLNEMAYAFEEMQAEEQNKYDNMPEQFQDSSTGERIQAWADALEDAFTAVNDAISALEGVE